MPGPSTAPKDSVLWMIPSIVRLQSFSLQELMAGPCDNIKLLLLCQIYELHGIA